MPLRFNTPNALIYLGAILRPARLQPHLRVPSICEVDFRGLRKAGFNAVVIDKDNCLTLPESDVIHPPLQAAWNDLLSVFEPGKVLVVSNSAGTLKKDPDSIAAEAVSLSLDCPVLLHPIPKPGCANLIIDYFGGSLGAPTTLRSELAKKAEALRQQEEEDEKYMIGHLEALVEGPLLGPLVDSNGNKVKVAPRSTAAAPKMGREAEEDGRPLEERMSARQREASAKKAQEKTAEKSKAEATPARLEKERKKDALRILVIGDRLFTDTLLANRLALHLKRQVKTQNTTSVVVPNDPSSPSSANPPISAIETPRIPSVISIHTTLLPQPKDVRVLRWIEDKLTRGRLRPGMIDWGRYIIDTQGPRATPPTRLTWRERINPFRDTPPLTIHPRSWRPAPLAVGLGHGVYWIASRLGRGIVILVQRAWAGEVEVAKVLASKVKGSEEKVELAASTVQSAEKDAASSVLSPRPNA